MVQINNDARFQTSCNGAPFVYEGRLASLSRMRQLLVLALLCLAPVASALDVEAELAVAGNTYFRGDVDARFTSAGIYYHSTVEQGEPTLVLHAKDVLVRLVDFPLVVTRTSHSHPIPGETLSEALPPEELHRETVSGTIRLLDIEEDARHYVLPSRGADLHHAIHGHVEVHIKPPDVWGPSVYSFEQPRPETGHERVEYAPDGWIGGMNLNRWDIHAEDAAMAFLHGATVEIVGTGTQTFWTGTEVEHRARDPDGLHEVTIVHRLVLLVEGELSANVAGTGWRSALRSVDGDWRGDFEFSKVAAKSVIRDENLSEEMVLLQVIGDVAVHTTYSQPLASWSLSGPATFVGIDGATVAGSRGPSSAVVAAMGLGFLALAWMAASHLGRDVLTVITGRNIATPMGNQKRLEIMRAITMAPGLDQTELRRRLGFSEAAVRHHLRVLVSCGRISSHEVAGRDVYALPGIPLHPASHLERHAARDAILRVLREREATYAEMSKTWQTRGEEVLKPDAVSYHGRLLEQAGLVYRRREGRRVKWGSKAAPQELSRPGRAYLIKEGLEDVFEAVCAVRSSNANRVHDFMARTGCRTTVGRVRDRLNHLYAAAFIDHIGDHKNAAPEPVNEFPASPMKSQTLDWEPRFLVGEA